MTNQVNTPQTTEKTNSLVFKTSKTVGNETIYVTIRLSDECKNGHQDFAITGDIYKAGAPKTDRNYIAGGCLHEEIEKHFPEFKRFIKLHLCDYSGAPMHAGANGFYFLQNGFNNTPNTSPQFKTKFCDYYRVTPQQFNVLATSQNVSQFSINLMTLGVLEQWRAEANEAIKELERLTGKTFVSDSVKGRFIAPTPEQIQEEEKRQKEGYYTEAAQLERREAAKAELFAKWDEEGSTNIDNIKQEIAIKKSLYNLGGSRFVEHCIYYKHSNTLGLNWRKYGEQLTPEEIELIKEKIKLPEGGKFKTN